MRHVVWCVLCLAAIGAFSARIQAQGKAAEVGGRWTVTFKFGNESVSGLALLEQAGDKLTGSIGANEQNQHPLDGSVKGNRITLTTHPRPGATAAFATCTLTVDGDKMTGTTEGGDLKTPTEITFVRQKR